MSMEGRTIWFLLYLLIAAWQDYRSREIDGTVFIAAGVVGAVVCGADCFRGGRPWVDVLLSCAVGIGLLGLGRISGGIGDGDGWFFVVSGLYLHAGENLMLFLAGLWVCFFISLPIAVRSILQKGRGRKRELPFLPCLLPFGVWLLIT